ncbi:uncharacterized protein LOC120351864 [Nilaparvata lugens]|uniref:uncharacterized protein LOC120351864 n=1 Tax=Nilaparvata lugens TaxID=108931 RepID=UPI00193C909A|nr:uncharacterized protein LOC120351864 [Nilaparvata lugens]
MADEGIEQYSNKRKKGSTNPSEYKRNVVKKARVKGAAYVNWKNQQQPEISQGADCKCKRRCYDLINEEVRNMIYAKFRSFETKNEQDSYLQSLISVTPVKQRRRREDQDESKQPDRGAIYVYEIPSVSGKYQLIAILMDLRATLFAYGTHIQMLSLSQTQ